MNNEIIFLTIIVDVILVDWLILFIFWVIFKLIVEWLLYLMGQ